MEFSTDGMKLKTDGVHVGEVVATHISNQQSRDNKHDIIQEVRRFDTFLQIAANSRDTPIQKIRTEWLECLFGRGDRTIPMSVVQEFYDSALARLPLPLDRRYDQFILDIFHETLCGCWMFLTSTGVLGRLLRVDGTVQEGDVLAIIKRTRNPFLLRHTATTGEYTLVGNLFVLCM